MRLLAARLTTAAVLALTSVAAGTASADTPEPTPAPLISSANAIPGSYIVTLDKKFDPAEFAKSLGLKTKFSYTRTINGFAASLDAKQLKAVRGAYGVQSVAEDASVSGPPAPAKGAQTKSPSNSWGLDRIDQRFLPLDNNFSANRSGQGVTAYILDSGIDYRHPDFGGRARAGFDAIGDGRNGQDCNGHGTHVAGTVGGTTFGVARKVNLVSVRVLGCDNRGAWSGIIAGFEWVARNAQQPAVLNASLGGGRLDAVNNAATAVSDRGVLPVIAAGNDNRDACQVSPASAARVVTVGATDRFDQETDFSNWGECLDIYAPGKDIISARLGGGSVSMNGTSMAAPHVTGVAALYKSEHPNALPAEVTDFLDEVSTKDIVQNLSDNSPNKLLFTDGL
ncbi:S8 family serine peptidase [Streptomyces sp. NPDC054904]|uniref:S8 family peptidase n=1 Tax=unclassified Streptomyces TaxID=2593676 RepID=UPI002481EB2B|nr:MULTISPECIES: S8 family peptidase [unclassified Streptomyces]MDA5279023.1 S8 family serine peptidase [Streptomyces sp. Isolate_45]MDX2395359.1 S8 family peptidase [Streptomyces sp. DK15]